MGIIAENSCDHSKSAEPLSLKLLLKVSIYFYKETTVMCVQLRIAGYTLNIIL